MEKWSSRDERKEKEEEETEGWVKTLRDHPLLSETITGEMGGRRIGLKGGGVMYSVLSAPPTQTHTHNSVFTYHPWTYSPSSTILWHFPIEFPIHSNSTTKPQCSQSAAQVPLRTSCYHNHLLRMHNRPIWVSSGRPLKAVANGWYNGT